MTAAATQLGAGSRLDGWDGLGGHDDAFGHLFLFRDREKPMKTTVKNR